ncbi:MAG TPA: zinc-binding dehydrogenase [Kofleriaceae bacterium]|jgi:NADPH:quinone reductase-like Zn-dependent oxidoreductase
MHARALQSTLTADGHIRLAIADVELGDPGPDEVVVRIDAAPVNPTDLYLMLAMADLSRATVTGGAVVAPVSPAVVALFPGRIDKPLPIGTEGAGTVVAAGANAQALVGKVVAAAGGGMFATHRKLPAGAVRELPAGRTAEDGASSFVNPMTALSFVETMRAEGHTAIVHTAAASNLGQMLVKICAADRVPLVNLVRRPAQVEQLRALGADHVVDSSAASYAADLVSAVGTTGATIAFDAIGGGPQVSQILDAMERAAVRAMPAFSHYGSTTHKQVYIYGSLDRGPTPLVRTFGMTWSVGGYLVSNALKKLGAEAFGRMTKRVMSELTTTFASHYKRRVGLDQLLELETLRACAATATGEKMLITAAR